MNRVEEIEAAIESLSSEEFRRIVEWLREREQQRWDEQIDCDAAAGRLDFLFADAERDAAQGLLREWPPEISNQ